MVKQKRKAKDPYPGYKLVENTTGKIIDSIWHNEEKQELMIRFATGEVLYHKPLEEESKIIREDESKD